MKNNKNNVDVARIEEAIHMLNTYVNEEGINLFVSLLEAIMKEPENESHLAQLRDAFKNLGIIQGAVLTHAPSIYDLIVDDPFGDKETDAENN